MSHMSAKNIYERFLWFDHKVRSKRYPNTTALSKEFEISPKTAQRDIEFMRDRLRCPLLYDQSRKGYYYRDETFSLPMIYLSSEELSSLLIAKKMLQGIDGDFIKQELSSAIDKITGILKKHSLAEDEIENALSFQMVEYSPAPEEIFKAVLNGCIKRKCLSFTYYSPASDERIERAVDPYHLLNYMGTWYLIAYCHLRNEIRSFNMVRMSSVKAMDRIFTVQKGFDIKEYLKSGFGIYKGSSLKQVTLRFSPQKSKWIKGQIWDKDQKEKVLKDGSIELTFPVASYAEIMMEILKHGSDVEVIKPKSLRELIKSEAKKITKIY